MSSPVEELRQKVVLSHRVLAMFGLYRETVGHTSARVPDGNEMLIRCRGGDERGMAFTTEDQIRRLDFDGTGPDLGNYTKVGELPIHGEIYKAHSDIGCVVHAHPPYAMLCATAGIELRPIIGGFDPRAMTLALGGVPVYERSVLVSTPELAASMLAVMGSKNVLLMKHHGSVATGRTVEEATVNSIKLERLARLHWEFAKAGKTPPNISQQDVEFFTAQFPALSAPGGRAEDAWRYYVTLLEVTKGVPLDILA